MLGNLGTTWRLLRAARTLAAHDALAPAELRALLPWWTLTGLSLLRLTAWRRGAGKRRPGQRFAAALAELGPNYIKLGQFLATRPDVIGSEVAHDLAELQDRLPPFPLEEAKAAIEIELGQKADAFFSELSEPIAAASIAQVHRAFAIATTMGADGVLTARRTPVAVKVLRPGIEARFQRDLDVFFLVARQVERHAPSSRRLRPVAVVETLAETVRLEMDLRLEAAAAAELAERTRNDEYFRVPVIDWEHTAKRVLTSEWIDGIPLKDKDALKVAGHDLHELATRVIRAFLSQALRDGFFHADMHQGNLFADAQGRLVAVDFGIMGRLDVTMRRFMAETLYGFLARDYHRIAQAHFDVGFVRQDKSIDAFAQALRSVGERVFGRPAHEISMARLLAQLFEVTEMFDMPLQPQLVLLQKTMVVVEGVARDLDPTHNIWESSRPVIERWMTDSLSPEARLRGVAENLESVGRVLEGLPDAMRRAERAMTALGDGSLRLHPDSAEAIAASEARRSRTTRVAVWIGALALVALATAQFI